MKQTTIKKAVSILSVFILLVSLICPIQAHELHGTKQNVSPRALFKPTGDYAYDIVQYAKTQLGKGNIYLPGEAWCAAFVKYCARQVGVSTSDIPNSNSCYGLYNTASGLSHTNLSSYTPKMGDLIFFSDTGSISNLTHVGIVESCDSTYVYTIEGNYDSKVSSVRHRRSNTDNYIVAYFTPMYTGTQHTWTEYTLYKVCDLCGLKNYYSQRIIAPDNWD